MKWFDKYAGRICAAAIWLLCFGTRCVRCEMAGGDEVELHGI
jgi:hypothetical protein